MLGSITKATAAAGYDLLVSFQNLKDDWQAVYEDSNKADGLILLGYGSYTDYEYKLSQLEEHGTHFLRWGAPDKNHPGISIGCDNFLGGVEVTKHLVNLGHSSFAFIGDADDSAPEFKARFDGFMSVLEETHFDTSKVVQKDAISTELAGYQAAIVILEGKHPDAIVCASDLIAMGAIRAIRSKGLKVPKDIAVVGYDNIQISEFASTPLTTVQQNTQLAGELLVSNLLKLINNEPVTDYLMPPELIVRESCGYGFTKNDTHKE
jgi:DNA-binding LacI/PurR family transcriptional regulator